VGFGAGQGVGQRISVHVSFEHGGAERNLPCDRKGVKQCIDDMFTGQKIFRLGRIPHEFAGVIPFAPATDEAGLHDINDVRVFLKNGFQLGNMPQDLILCGVERAALIRMREVLDVVGISKTEDAFGAPLSVSFQTGSDYLKICIRDIRGKKVFEPEFAHIKRSILCARRRKLAHG
jgi:hypothetical protein